MLNDLAEAIRRWTEKKGIGFFTCLSVWRCASLFVSALCFTPYCQSTVMHKPSPFHFAGTFLGFACLFFLFFRLFLVFGTVTASELPVLMPAFSLLSPWMRRVVFFCHGSIVTVIHFMQLHAIASGSTCQEATDGKKTDSIFLCFRRSQEAANTFTVTLLGSSHMQL